MADAPREVWMYLDNRGTWRYMPKFVINSVRYIRADLAPPSRDSAQVPVAWTKSEYIKGHLSPASWILVDEGLKKYSRNSDAYDQPLYTAPAPDEGVDARDAERYRWLRAHPVWQVQELPNELELLDAAIDAALAADRGRAGGDEGEKG